MALNLRTPGVYIVEESKFPPSVVPVETAIPAFFGYTRRDAIQGRVPAQPPGRGERSAGVPGDLRRTSVHRQFRGDARRRPATSSARSRTRTRSPTAGSASPTRCGTSMTTAAAAATSSASAATARVRSPTTSPMRISRAHRAGARRRADVAGLPGFERHGAGKPDQRRPGRGRARVISRSAGSGAEPVRDAG